MEINAFWQGVISTGFALFDYFRQHQVAILALLGGSAGLSLGLQTILHKLEKRFGIDEAAFAFTLLNILTAFTAVGDWYLSSSHPDVAPTYTWLTILAQTWHRFAINPFYRAKFIPWLQRRAEEKQANINAQARLNHVQPAVISPEDQVVVPSNPVQPSAPASPFEVTT